MTYDLRLRTDDWSSPTEVSALSGRLGEHVPALA